MREPVRNVLLSLIIFYTFCDSLYANPPIIYRQRRYYRYVPAPTYVPQPKPRLSYLSRDPRTGGYFGISLLFDYNMKSDQELTKTMYSGFGFNAFLGVRPNQYMAFDLGFNSSWMKTDKDYYKEAYGGLHGLTLDFKLFIMPKSFRIEPYLQLGCGIYWYTKPEYPQYNFSDLVGGGFHLGGGIDFRINPVVGIELSLLYKGIYLESDMIFEYESALFNQLVPSVGVLIYF